MKIQFSIRDLLLIVAIVALTVGWWIDHQRINKVLTQKWEYDTYYHFYGDPEKLKDAGDDGWEACAMAYDSNMKSFLVVFKRPVR